MIKNVYWSSCKVPVILGRFWRDLNFLTKFSRKTQISNLINNRPVRAELFHADGQTGTGMTKLIVTFRSFTNAPKDRKASPFIRAYTSNRPIILTPRPKSMSSE